MSQGAITHVFTHLLGLGGVSSMLRRHLQTEGKPNRERAVILFERGPFGSVAQPGQVTGLGLRWFHTGRAIPRRWRQALPSGLGGKVVYHNAWGLGSTASLDNAQRRIVLLHSRWPGADDLIRAVSNLCDGWICVSEPLHGLVASLLPDLPEDRLLVLPVPVGAPRAPVCHPNLNGRPLVLGYSGRLIREAKRVDRLPELDRELAAAGVDRRWEIMGDGPDLDRLRRRMVEEKTTFRGRLAGAEYWEALSGCDVLVFTSDYEGFPISLVEGLSRGVFPLFPRIGSGADHYVARIAPELLYRPGDLADAARAVRWLTERSPVEIEALRDRLHQVAEPHLGNDYDRGFAGFMERMESLPRLSADGISTRRRHPGEWIPFGLLGRLPSDHWLRRGYV